MCQVVSKYLHERVCAKCEKTVEYCDCAGLYPGLPYTEKRIDVNGNTNWGEPLNGEVLRKMEGTMISKIVAAICCVAIVFASATLGVLVVKLWLWVF